MLGLTALLLNTPVPRPVWGLPRPNGRVALTISRIISWPNLGDTLALDTELLRGFDSQEVEASVPARHGPETHAFRGVAITEVLLAAGRRGDELGLTSNTGYRVQTSTRELHHASAIVATEMDGMPLPCTRYGPLWLVFPDQTAGASPVWRRQQLSVWGLTEIVVS